MSEPAQCFKTMTFAVVAASLGLASAQSLGPHSDDGRLGPRRAAERDAAPEVVELDEVAAMLEEIDPRDPDAVTGTALHLASYYTEADALRGWTILEERHPAMLSGLEPLLRDADLGERGVFIRLLAGPVPSRAEADRRCRELTMDGAYCAPAKPSGDLLPIDSGYDG